MVNNQYGARLLAIVWRPHYKSEVKKTSWHMQGYGKTVNKRYTAHNPRYKSLSV
jgi:hypothetical protein